MPVCSLGLDTATWADSDQVGRPHEYKTEEKKV